MKKSKNRSKKSVVLISLVVIILVLISTTIYQQTSTITIRSTNNSVVVKNSSSSEKVHKKRLTENHRPEKGTSGDDHDTSTNYTKKHVTAAAIASTLYDVIAEHIDTKLDDIL